MLEAARPSSPAEALRRFFGFEDFRSAQREIIQSVLDGDDTLVVMPTGGGKSLCYQVPALLLRGVTVVVSPLIALMKDQVDALEQRGIRATTINSTLEFGALSQRLNDIRHGLYSLVYVAPERFENPRFLEQMAGVRIALFAIDEAHCISEWGHDFRPSYLKLREALEHFARPPVIALTATATPSVQEDIVRQLGLKRPRRFVRGFDRPNLAYSVAQGSDKDATLRRMLTAPGADQGSVIVYCGTRRSVERVGTMLHAERLPVTIYHAGMKDADRRAAQEAFISGRARVIVATNAFGMGIDKPDVRQVVHYDMPGSIEAYYQEAGRAGRDGNPAACTLLADGGERRLQEFFIRTSCPTRDQVNAVYDALWDVLQVGLGSRCEGVFVPDRTLIAARAKIHVAALSSVLNVLERNGVLRFVRADRLAAVRFIAGSDEIQRYFERTRDEERRSAIVALLRTLGGAALTQQTFFNFTDVAGRYSLSPVAFERHLRALMAAGLLEFTPPTPGRGVQFLAERLPARNVRIDEAAIESGRERSLRKLDAMVRYVNGTTCRRNVILEYFCAEIADSTCGRCDCCTRIDVDPTPVARFDAELSPRHRRAADLLLAAAVELGGRFGKMTLVDILRGVRPATSSSAELERYPRFGALADIERTELARLAEWLLERRLLERSATMRPVVRATSAGRAKVRHLSLTVFSISGAGEQRDEDEPRAASPFERELPIRLLRTYQLWGEGCSLEEIAGRSALQPSTVSNHVQELLEAGAAMPIEHFVTGGIVRRVRDELERMPRATLRELRALLGGAVEYPQLRIAAAWVRTETLRAINPDRDGKPTG